MEQDRMRRLETLCTQEEPPACAASCPMHVDARGMCVALSKGDFNAALAIYQKAIPFPAIISRVCDAPCEDACLRKEIGGSIRIRDLERACIELGEAKPKRLFMPGRAGRAAVLGGGLSGLTAALELGRKGYSVTLFEATDQLGGLLRACSEEELPKDCIERDLKRLGEFKVQVRLSEPVEGIEGLQSLRQGFDALYVATGGAGGFDLGPIDEITLLSGLPGVFAGGRLRQATYSPIRAMEDGRRAALSIDRFLQGVSLGGSREREGAFETGLYTNIEGILPEKAVEAEGCYTTAQAVEEARRCIRCECLECVKGCAFLAHYKAYPKRYVREVYNNLTIVMGTRHANGMINACSLCGQCGALCPNGLNMAEVFSKARSIMVETGKMPPSAHDFALRDLAFSNSEAYFLARRPKGKEENRYAFFPGCQLGASAPGVVRAAYEDLSGRLPGGVGLMLGCCGVIADWAGQAELFQATLQKLRLAWQSLGEPQIIAGCPTCYVVLRENLPEMRPRGIWDVLEEIGLPSGHAMGAGKTLAVQDACTVRFEGAVQESVRRLAGKMGYVTAELPYGREKTQCCGYGGLAGYANPEVAREMARHWAEQNEADYLAYCANCRDSVHKCGKRALHLLELAYPAAAPQGDVAGYSARRENREKLRAAFLREVWEEDVLNPAYEIEIELAEGLADTLEARMILLEDVEATLAEAEGARSYLQDAQSGQRVASLKRGAVTYWVNYSPGEGAFLVHNAYSHRMDIEV